MNFFPQLFQKQEKLMVMTMSNLKKYSKSQLLCYLQEICAIIYFQNELSEQDSWLNDRIKDGIWNLDLCEDEEYEKGFKKEGEEE